MVIGGIQWGTDDHCLAPNGNAGAEYFVTGPLKGSNAVDLSPLDALTPEQVCGPHHVATAIDAARATPSALPRHSPSTPSARSTSTKLARAKLDAAAQNCARAYALALFQRGRAQEGTVILRHRFPEARYRLADGGFLENTGAAPAIAALEAAAREAGFSGLTAATRDLNAWPVSGPSLRDAGAVVIDPPRAGAEAQIAEIVKAMPPVLAYVSCNPVTFARDAAVLIAAGYTLNWVQVVDQFRWSSHVELAAQFTAPEVQRKRK